MYSPLRDPSLPEIRQDETRPLITVHFCCRDDLCYSRPIAGNLMTVSDGIRAKKQRKLVHFPCQSVMFYIAGVFYQII